MIGILKAALAEQITPGEMATVLRTHDAGLSADEAARLASALAPFIVSTTDACEWVIEVTKDPRCGRAVAFGTGSVLCYLMNDEDLLPESSFGAVGLVDDAFLVHAFAARVRQTFPYAAAPTRYTPPAPETVATAATLLPDGVATALLRMCDNLVEVGAALFVTGGLPAATDSTIAPLIRPRAAVDVMAHASA